MEKKKIQIYQKRKKKDKHTCALAFFVTTVKPFFSGAFPPSMPTTFLWMSPLYLNEFRLVKLLGSCNQKHVCQNQNWKFTHDAIDMLTLLKGFLIFVFLTRKEWLFRRIIQDKWDDMLTLLRLSEMKHVALKSTPKLLNT